MNATTTQYWPFYCRFLWRLGRDFELGHHVGIRTRKSAILPHLNLTWRLHYQIREQAISRLTILIKEKPIPERITLGRKYRVKDWLKEEYITLVQNPHLKMEDLRDPSGIQLDWESVSKIMSVRDRNMLNNLRSGRNSSGYHCGTCNVYYGYNHDVLDCRCRLQTLIDEVFKEEFQDLARSSSDLSTSPPLPTSM